MKKLLTVLLFLFQVSLYSQTITKGNGEVFDIRNVESGSIVEYKFSQQGIFKHRNIYVDGEYGY